MSASRKCLKIIIIISRGKKRYQNLNFGFTLEESFSSCHLYFEVVQLLLAPRCANLSNSYMTQKKENKRIKRLTNNQTSARTGRTKIYYRLLHRRTPDNSNPGGKRETVRVIKADYILNLLCH